MAVRYVSELDAAQIAQATAHTHALWSEGLALDDHRALALEQVRRSAGVMRYVGLLDENGALVCSLKRYQLELAGDSWRVATVGIGAVFTPEAERGKAHASALLQAVHDEAATLGCAAALLFSDIAPSYYERFGYRRLAAPAWQCEVTALPREGSYEAAPAQDHDVLVRLRHAGLAGGWLHLIRNRRAWEYWIWRYPHDELLLFLTDAAVGYAMVTTRDELLWIHEIGGVLDPARLHATLRRLAVERGADRVAGWLRGDRAAGRFEARARDCCLPMVAQLGAVNFTRAPSHLSSIDSF